MEVREFVKELIRMHQIISKEGLTMLEQVRGIYAALP
jgi:hypothetical protein